jgi:hypothetical protein
MDDLGVPPRLRKPSLLGKRKKSTFEVYDFSLHFLSIETFSHMLLFFLVAS